MRSIALLVFMIFGTVAQADDGGAHDFIMRESGFRPAAVASLGRHATRSIAIPAGGHAMLASYYGGGPRRFEPNTHMANGRRFNQWADVCAHRTYPFGTRLAVSFRGRPAVCVVSDRGPARWTKRSLDVSRGIAHKIGLIGPGHGTVLVSVLR